MKINGLCVQVICAGAILAGASRANAAEDCSEMLRAGREAAGASNDPRALTLFEKAVQCFDAAHNPGRTSNALAILGSLLREQGKYDEAGPIFERSLRLLEPDTAPDSAAVASALNNLASHRQYCGKLDEAESMFRRAIGIWQSFPAETASLIRTLSNYSNLLAAKGDYTSARSTLERAVSLADVQTYPRDRATALGQLGILYGKMSHPKAEDVLREALSLRESMEGPNHLDTVFAKNNLGQYLSERGELQKSRVLIGQAYRDCTALLGNSARCAVMLNNLASIDEKSGNLREAEAGWTRALAMSGPAAAANPDAFIAACNNLSGHYAARGKFRQALPIYESAVAMLERNNGKGRVEYAKLMENLGALWMAEKKFGKAFEYLDRARSLDEANFGPFNARLALDYHNLGVLAARRKRLDEAESLFRKALEIDERNLGLNSSNAALRLASLGVIDALRKRYSAAVDLYGRAFSIWGDKTGLDSAAEARFLEDYAYCLKKTEDYASAEKIATRAMGIRVKAALHGPEKAMF